MTFLCGATPRVPTPDDKLAHPQSGPRPWWMRCDTCGDVLPYNDGIYNDGHPPVDICLTCRNGGQGRLL